MAPAYFGFQRRRVADVLFDEVSALSKSRNGWANSTTESFGRRMKLSMSWLLAALSTLFATASETITATRDTLLPQGGYRESLVFHSLNFTQKRVNWFAGVCCLVSDLA